MNKKLKAWERYSLESLADNTTDARGRLFLSELGQVNLEGVQVLHSGLDTIKQLYSGELRLELLQEVERLYGEGFGECLEVGGHVWMLGSGGASGYQFRLQNSDLGLIVFLKSRYAENDKAFSHLKIECSPHWLHARSVETMKRELDALADCFLHGQQGSGVAVHMCVDVQGWAPPANLSDRLVTRARRVLSHDSCKVLYWDMGEVALRYNQGQSYLFGSASSVQMAVYRKDVQAKAIDKLDFWQSVWNKAAGNELEQSAYDPSAPVWRIEVRFHHSVLADFGRGAAAQLEYGASLQAGIWSHIQGVSGHLTGLWQYGLNSFRLEAQGEKASQRYLDPFWQLLLDDVLFLKPVGELLYKRVKKTPGLGNEKNLMLAVGTLLSVYARHRFTPKQAFNCLKASGIYDDLCAYMERRANADYRNFRESDLFEFVAKALQLRTLLGKAA